MHTPKERSKVFKALFKRLTRRREYVFRFEYYDEDSRGNTIDDTNVVQYEFINQGNTVIDINGLLLQPNVTLLAIVHTVEPSRILLPIRENEMDVSIYRYKFLGPIPLDVPPVSLLLVISKVKADIATNKKG